MDKETTDHGYTISSSCEPKGLGELTKRPSQCIHCVPINMWIFFKIKLSVGTSDIHITCIGSLPLLTFLYTFVFVPPTRAGTSEKALNAC